jgi:hypothetical protein
MHSERPCGLASLNFRMHDDTPKLFTESALGGLPMATPWPGQLSAREPGAGWAGAKTAAAPEPLTFVETLGFPKGTPALLLAQVLEEISATPAGTRVQRLLSPGMLSRLFSQSAAEASYALAVLSIVESRDFAATLARLRCC